MLTTPAPRPERITLPGKYVSLRPLRSSDAEELWEAGADVDELWRYMWSGPFPDLPSFQAHIDSQIPKEDPLFYAICDNETGRAIGEAAYLRIEPNHRVIEVGHILYTACLQRTRGATEAMYLMAKYAFDLGYRRYEWKCNAANAKSQAAARRLGFTYEGTFRQHMIVKGENRDTAWFAMLNSEWPEIQARFEYWLRPENFDELGAQLSRLNMAMGAKP